jgi:hypothetical protein
MAGAGSGAAPDGAHSRYSAGALGWRPAGRRANFVVLIVGALLVALAVVRSRRGSAAASPVPVAVGREPDVTDHEGIAPRLKASRKRDRRFLAALGGVTRAPRRRREIA